MSEPGRGTDAKPKFFIDTDLRANLVAAALLIGVSIVYVAESIRLPSTGVSTSDTGPRLYTLTIGVPLLLLCLIYGGLVLHQALTQRTFITAIERNTKDAASHEANLPFWKRPHLLAVLATLALIAGMQVVGFAIATTVFLFVVTSIVRGAPMQWNKAVPACLFAVASTLIIIAGLEYGLGVRLPDGDLGMGW